MQASSFQPPLYASHPLANLAERFDLAAAIAPPLHDVPDATGWKTGAMPPAGQMANWVPSGLQTRAPGVEQELELEPEVGGEAGAAAGAAGGEAAAGAAAAGEAAAPAAAGATEGEAPPAAGATEGEAPPAAGATEGAAPAGEATEGAAAAPPAAEPPLGEAA